MMHLVFKVMNTDLWYLDSGYSRHITGDRTLFKEFESKKGEMPLLVMEANPI